VVVAASCSCSGCDRIPGTEAFFEEKAERVVREQLLDPISAQFRNVESLDGHVCGEVNAKNKIGAYTGFTRFVVDTATNQAVLDPQFDFTDLLSARELCTEVSGNEYSSVSTTVSACNRAGELEIQQSRQQSFDDAWAHHCQGVARQIYRPPLQSSVLENAAHSAGGAESNDAISQPDASAEPLPDSAPSDQSARDGNDSDLSANEPDLNNTV
jgi:hypothetical protein